MEANNYKAKKSSAVFDAGVILEHLKKVCISKNVQSNLEETIKQLEAARTTTTTVAALSIPLSDISGLFDISLDVTDMEDHTFGYSMETKSLAWNTPGGRQVTLSDIEISEWLDIGINKVIRNTTLHSHESAVRSIINLVLIEALDILQTVRTTKHVSTDMPAPVATVPGHSVSDLQKTLPNQKNCPPTAASSIPISPDKSSTPSHHHSQAEMPSTPTKTQSHEPIPLQLFYEANLHQTIVIGGADGQVVKVSGIADYTIGYAINTSRFSIGMSESVGYLVAVEAKKTGSIIEAVPQCIVYMSMTASSRSAVGRTNSVVYGVCSSGFEFLFLRLDNDREVIRSQVFNIKRESQRKAMVEILVSILHAARASSPQTTPCKDSKKGSVNVMAFREDENKQKIDFGVEDWLVFGEAVVVNEDKDHEMLDPSFPAAV